MNQMSVPLANSLETELFKRIFSSEIFARFEDAFRSATGLPLRLIRWDEDFCISQNRENQSPFCEMINRCEVSCEACRETNRKLIEEVVKIDGPKTCGCFSGLCATAVPVKLGKTILGFLKTGQVFQRQPSEKDFARVLEKVGPSLSPDEEGQLRSAYFETKQVDPQRYESMVTLLNLFADQLSEYAESVTIATTGNEPAGILAARKMIHQNLEDPIELDQVARAAGMSKSHFCRTFKEVTSMTVTEYTTRARITWARKELLRPDVQVSEIAYKVGFQSLSQFNRSFVKLVGKSPSAFRKEQLEKANI